MSFSKHQSEGPGGHRAIVCLLLICLSLLILLGIGVRQILGNQKALRGPTANKDISGQVISAEAAPLAYHIRINVDGEHADIYVTRGGSVVLDSTAVPYTCPEIRRDLQFTSGENLMIYLFWASNFEKSLPHTQWFDGDYYDVMITKKTPEATWVMSIEAIQSKRHGFFSRIRLQNLDNLEPDVQTDTSESTTR